MGVSFSFHQVSLEDETQVIGLGTRQASWGGKFDESMGSQWARYEAH